MPNGGVLARYDISTESPALVQTIGRPSATSLGLSHNGQMVGFNSGQRMTLFSGADLTTTLGSVLLGLSSAGPIAFSTDDSMAFQSAIALFGPGPHKIVVIDTRSFQTLRTIILAEKYGASHLVVDSTNTYLFSYSSTGVFNTSDLKVYAVQPVKSPGPPRARSLLNISTRLRAQGDENALIGGFIIKGTDAKQVVLRAMGPSLPLGGKLADPALELYDASGAIVDQNDNWNAHRAGILATGFAPSDEHEAVIARTLQPGSYTAIVRGVNGQAGVALIEAYDLSGDSDSKLANISTRGKVETADNVMIGGFIIGGGQPTNVVVRAIGPSLGGFVTQALGDPMLEVHDGNGALLAQDDDWRTFQEQPLIESGLAPIDDREAAILLHLQPGSYTAIVQGKSNSTGVGLVEVYNLDTN